MAPASPDKMRALPLILDQHDFSIYSKARQTNEQKNILKRIRKFVNCTIIKKIFITMKCIYLMI